VFAPYRVEEAGGIRVGIVSILSPEAKLVSEAGDLAGIEITDPAEALAEILPTLREESDVIVLLSALEQQASRQLARELGAESGVNFMIEANSSSHYGKALNIHGIKLLAANPRGKYLGEISLGLADGQWNGEFEYVQYNVDSREPGDKAVGQRVREFLDSKKMATGSK
jgi:2',3'-cyclic-nucleotide 2'-phosphodiesterase (5'-nucleotidase family)